MAVTGEKFQATGASIEAVGNKIMPASAVVAGLGAVALKTKNYLKLKLAD